MPLDRAPSCAASNHIAACSPVAETWRRSLGGTEQIFADQDDDFSEQIYILAAQISDDLFLVIDQVFRILLIFRIFSLLSVVHDPFFPLKKNTFFYSFHIFAYIRQRYFSKYWGGGECVGRPPTSNFGRDRPPVPPRFPPLL